MPTTAAEICRRLRQWPRGLTLDQRAAVRQVLEACRAAFDAPVAVMAWEEADEPWLIVASITADQRFSWVEEEPERYTPLVNPPLSDVTFYASGDQLRTSVDVIPSSAPPIHEQFRSTFGLRDVLSTPVRGTAVQGRVFIRFEDDVDELTLLLGEVVGLLVERDMDYVVSIRSASAAAVHEERVRVARDLHDGLLQSFTGVVLHLETIHSMIESQPQEAKRKITDIQGVIMGDQRELRSYVEQLRPRRRIDVPFDFRGRLEEWRSRFETQWGIGVAFDIENVDPLVARSLGPETFRIIQEAVTNSAKHGSASQVRVRLTTGDSRMRIEVVDDGSGFPFHGRLTLDAIRESGVGPAMLAERVAALNGDLAVESSDSGARLEISVPLGFVGG
jgi:signal transduction histidine kinase